MNPSWEGDRFERVATDESLISDRCHRVRDGDGGERPAVRKDAFSNRRHPFGNGDGAERGAVPEGPLFDRPQRSRKRHRFHRDTAIEGKQCENHHSLLYGKLPEQSVWRILPVDVVRHDVVALESLIQCLVLVCIIPAFFFKISILGLSFK